MIMPWMNAHAARARSGPPRRGRAVGGAGFQAGGSRSRGRRRLGNQTGTIMRVRPRRSDRYASPERGQRLGGPVHRGLASAAARLGEPVGE